MADQIQLDPAFHAKISSEIQKLAQALGHPTKVIAKLHKLVIYQPGDFFKTHIDSPHGNAEPMIFTASVQLKGNESSSGGDLVVGKDKIPSVKYGGEVGIALFYHDQPHSVTKLEHGFRLSLTFDVVDSGIPNSDVIRSNAVFADVLAKGFKNVGIRSSYSYLASKQVTADQLKGTDKVFCELALAAGAKSVEICRVYENTSSFLEGGLFREELLPLMKLDSRFDSLYYDYEWEQQETREYYEREAKKKEEARKLAKEQGREEEANKIEAAKEENSENEYPAKRLPPMLPYLTSIPSPSYDDGTAVAVKDEYRLGNTLFLATAVPWQLKYRGNIDAYLGNDGFSGNVYSNLAIIAHF